MLTSSKFRDKWSGNTYFYIAVVLGTLGIVVTESLFEWAFLDDALFVMIWFISSLIALITLPDDGNRSSYTRLSTLLLLL